MSMPAEVIASRITADQLLDGIAAAPPINVAGIASDSRKVKPGFLFLACQGATSHGLDFVEQVRGIRNRRGLRNVFECFYLELPGISLQLAGLQSSDARFGKIFEFIREFALDGRFIRDF